MLALASLLLACWGGGRAHAQATGGGDDEAAAGDLVEQAARAYDQNQLDEALRLLSRAYQLSPRPSILYNQAQVLRAKDDCAAALDAYQRFIAAAAPGDADRERAERRRDEMQACVARRSPPAAPVQLNVQEVTRPEPPAGVVVGAPVEAPAPDHPPSHRRAMRAAGWTLLGVGLVAAGAAAVLAWQARSIQNELNADLQQTTFVWGPAQAARARDGQNDANRAWWCAGLAAVAGAGSGALFLLSRPAARADGPVTASIQTRGGLVGWSGSF